MKKAEDDDKEEEQRHNEDELVVLEEAEVEGEGEEQKKKAKRWLLTKWLKKGQKEEKEDNKNSPSIECHRSLKRQKTTSSWV